MDFLLWRTAANQLLVLCWSSGWSPQPLVSVLDWTGSRVPTVGEPQVAVQPDGLFSVSVHVNVEAVSGNGTMLTPLSLSALHALLLPVLCSTLRTKKQERDLSGGGPPSAPGPREDGLHHRWRRSPAPHIFERLESWKLIGQKLTAFFSDSSPGVDDFLQQEAGPGQVLAGVLAVFVCVCVVVGAAARYVAPGRRMDTSDSLTGASSGPRPGPQPRSCDRGWGSGQSRRRPQTEAPPSVCFRVRSHRRPGNRRSL